MKQFWCKQMKTKRSGIRNTKNESQEFEGSENEFKDPKTTLKEITK